MVCVCLYLLCLCTFWFGFHLCFPFVIYFRLQKQLVMFCFEISQRVIPSVLFTCSRFVSMIREPEAIDIIRSQRRKGAPRDERERAPIWEFISVSVFGIAQEVTK